MEGPSRVDGTSTRVVLHIDMDSYYTQVEMKRLGIPRDTPCAVQQWEGLIAVNYPARARGITRHMRVKEAKKVCPELVLVHVETLGADGSSDDPGSAAAAAAAAGGGGQESRRLTQKACLERYRRATAEVLALLHRLAPAAVIEKASIDEVYMDVTSLVDQEVQGRAAAPVDAFAWGSIVIGGPLDVGSEFERRLAVGAGIACRLRGALQSELAFTASTGIAGNKLLAKIGSAMHKPNQQTVIPQRGALQVMQDLPLAKLRGFGGKLGEQLEELGCTTAGQVQQLSHASLAARFGAERATYIEQAVRGVSHEAVQERERPKSMLAAKSFNPTYDLEAIRKWCGILAQELAGRMAADSTQFRRRPKNLVVHYRQGVPPANPRHPPASSEHSKSCPMPRFTSHTEPSAEAVADAAFKLFTSKIAAEAMPCSRLAISAADFTELPASAGAAITRFLVPKGAAGSGSSDVTSGSASAAMPTKGGGAAAAGATAAGADRQQPPSAPSPGQQQQQQQQQQQPGGRQQGGGQQGGTHQGARGGGPSIGSLFERAQKRQRLAAGQQEQEQQQRHEQQAQQQQQEPQQQQPASPAGGAVCPSPVQPPPMRQPAGAAAAAPAAAAADEPPQSPLRGAAPPAEPSAGGLQGEPGDGTEEGVAAVPAAHEAAESAAEALGVDVEEQKRILREIRMMQRLGGKPKPPGAGGGGGGGGGGAGGGGRPAGGGAGAGKQQAGVGQRDISAFFKRPGS